MSGDNHRKIADSVSLPIAAEHIGKSSRYAHPEEPPVADNKWYNKKDQFVKIIEPGLHMQTGPMHSRLFNPNIGDNRPHALKHAKLAKDTNSTSILLALSPFTSNYYRAMATC